MIAESDEDLRTRLENFDQHRESLHSRKSRLEQDLRNQQEEREAVEMDLYELVKQQAKLEAERKVSCVSLTSSGLS